MMHHLSIGWPEAHVSGYDAKKNGALPEDFAGANYDLIVLSSNSSPMNAMRRVRHFGKRANFPPVVYVGETSNSEEREQVSAYGAEAVLFKDELTHEAVLDAIKVALRSRQDIASTQSLFMSEEAGSLALRGYRLIEKISGGDFSSVYLTESLASGERQVLKVVRQVPDSTEIADEIFSRFLQEFELISSLKHPNIVSISDFGVGDDHAFIAMEYFPAGDLRNKIINGISADDALRALREIAGALKAIHELGILHRDLKPGNVMCREDGSVALIDFGLAKQLRLAAEITGTGEIFGTPYYMSPEQGHGKPADKRSDIYSLGVIFYELLTAKKPFVADTAMGIIYKHSNAPRPQLPAEFQSWQAILEKMLAIKPSERFSSAASLCTALEMVS